MCGIALAIAGNDSEHIVKAILNHQKQRGPDHSGIRAIERSLGFIGHNRLNIVDQNRDSNQPFVSACGGYVLSFNGEIYNHQELRHRFLFNDSLRTNSDTEVLVELWARIGIRCLDYLVGMFAFVIHSIRENKIYVVRDRFGKKPVFYYYDPIGRFVVSSELRALLQCGLKDTDFSLDYNILKIYLDYGLYDSFKTRTFVKNIYKVPPASVVAFDLSSCEITSERFWCFEDIYPKDLPEREINNVEEEIYELIRDAVQIRTKSSVPFVLNLSGGVDSAVIMAVLREERCNNLNQELYGYHAESEGRSAREEKANLQAVIDRWGISCRFIPVKTDHLKSRIDDLVRVCDGPIGGFATLGYYQLHKAIHSDGFRLAIDGQGADEVLLGYDKYLLSNHTDMHIDGTMNSYFSFFAERPGIEEISDQLEGRNSIYSDLFGDKLQRNLRMNDRLSMANSVELRCPFLDHRIYEKSFSLPRELFTASKNSLKYPLKNLFKHFYKVSLPNKNGKVTNQTESLFSKNFELVQDSLTKLNETFSGEIQFQRVRLEIEKMRTEGTQNSFQIWRMLVLQSIIDGFGPNRA